MVYDRNILKLKLCFMKVSFKDRVIRYTKSTLLASTQRMGIFFCCFLKISGMEYLQIDLIFGLRKSRALLNSDLWKLNYQSNFFPPDSFKTGCQQSLRLWFIGKKSIRSGSEGGSQMLTNSGTSRKENIYIVQYNTCDPYEVARSSNKIGVQLQMISIYFRLKFYLKTLLVSRDRIGWKMIKAMRLKYDAVWVKPNMVNVNNMDYDL